MSEALTLSDLAPYITGHKFFGKAKVSAKRATKQQLEDFLTLIEEDDIAKSTLENLEIANEFYEIMTDFKHFIPSDIRTDVFYAAKLGGEYYSEVPSFCTYMLKKCYEQCNGLPNLIFKYMPTRCTKAFLSEGFFASGISMLDAICNICDKDYTPVSTIRPKCKHELFTEIYVAATDMIAAVPNSIAELLTDASCGSIEVTGAGLAIGGSLLRTMADHIGAINSIYDLRELL